MEQEFIVTNGITEMCIFGNVAILKHEFVLCGKTKAICIVGQEGTTQPSYQGDKEMKVVGRESIPPFTTRFVETTISGAGYSLLAGFPFVFSPARVSPDLVFLEPGSQGNLSEVLVSRIVESRSQENLPEVIVSEFVDNRGLGNLPEELIIEESYNVTRGDGIYHILAKNASKREIVLQKGCTLRTIEMGCRIVGAVREEIAQDLDTGKEDCPKTLDEAYSIELAVASVDERFRPRMKKLLTEHTQLFLKGYI